MRDKILDGLPSRDALMTIMHFDPELGSLTWRSRTVGCNACGGKPLDQRTVKSWESRRTGKPALDCTNQKGYKNGKIANRHYLAHRVIWKMVFGTDPQVIDHKNGCRSDNRISNLRSCSIRENSRNTRLLKGGTSRFRGVCWSVRDKVWTSSINDNESKRKNLGGFTCEIEAARAYDRAAMEYHGEFASLNFPDEHHAAAIKSAFTVGGA